MTEQYHGRGMKHHRPSERSFSSKLMMAIVAVGLLLAALYVLQDRVFPTNITFKNVGVSTVPYFHQREAP